VTVALGTHPLLPDGSRTHPPNRRRVDSGCIEDGHLVRRDTAVDQGRVDDEPGKPATDDGNLSRSRRSAGGARPEGTVLGTGPEGLVPPAE
jgi:hypothetical protein